MIVTQLSSLLLATVLPCMTTLVTPTSIQPEVLSYHGHSNVYVLEAHAATYNIYQAQVITNFDWFIKGDKIGLTGGLTEDDLDYMELIDFDEDGFLDDVVIKLKSTQEILGIVLNADDFVIAGEFVSVSSTRQSITCVPQINIISFNISGRRLI